MIYGAAHFQGFWSAETRFYQPFGMHSSQSQAILEWQVVLGTLNQATRLNKVLIKRKSVRENEGNEIQMKIYFKLVVFRNVRELYLYF